MVRRDSPVQGLICALVVATVAFLLGINWGLPNRSVDRYLFGNHPVWSGAKIAELAPSDANQLGADVDVNPISGRDHVVVLNQADSQRAEIIRRYRLYSDQPDEMITLRSLSQIQQHHGDPRLYQYGGLWIYPVGVLIRCAMWVVAISTPPAGISAQVYYLDHPEAFARFYIVARLYSAIWGLIAVGAVWWIIRRITGRELLPAIGAIAFAVMPVVITMSHEAKPHLPGLALALLAVVAATKFIESGGNKWALLAGVFCGGATGMVLSGLLSFTILPVMVLLRRDPPRRRIAMLLLSGAIGILTYLICNPFVLINAIFHPAILRSNLGNSSEMYHITASGFGNAIALLAEGTSPVLAAAGVVGAIFVLFALIRAAFRGRRDYEACNCPGRGDAGWLLAAPAGLVLIQFFLLAAGKPPEYARFALLPDTFLLVAAFAAVGRMPVRFVRVVMSLALLLFTLPFGLRYVAGFVRDSGSQTSRLVVADRLAALADEGARTLRVPAEPAPYCMPPVDVFRYTLLLAPPGMKIPADVIVRMDHKSSLGPMSWADVRFTLVPAPAPPSQQSK
jgi:hypothetical protein